MKKNILLLASLTACFTQAETPTWDWAGWGGGGFYYSSVFHPTKDGVIYMGGDVCGVYKTEDHGLTWRLINDGLADYGVFSLAVDRTAPETVYAATDGGLCKSTDGGAHWRLLPDTGKKALRITGEKGKSTRCIAVDPADGKIVYAGSPAGKIYKSMDGGETWNAVYEKTGEKDPPEALRVQFGKVNDAYFGGFWIPFTFPEGFTSADCTGFGFTFRGDATIPKQCFLQLKCKDGTVYHSRNLSECFKQTTWGDITLEAKDFTLEPEYAKKNPEKAQAYSGSPDWSAVNRMDLACVGPLMNDVTVGKFTRFFFMIKGKPSVVKEFSKSKVVQSYGNLRIGSQQGGSVYSVAVAQKEPSLVVAATDDAGLVLSSDAGKTWRELDTPKKASSVAIAASDPKIIYGTFAKDGIWKSTDKGLTWRKSSQGIPADCSIHEVAVSPTNSDDVHVIGSVGWNGRCFYSADGGQTWNDATQLKPDPVASPTLPQEYKTTTGVSAPRNIAINPLNPKELYIAANWRPCHSSDGGRTWTERVRGADISCIYDLRFHKGKTYACAMDEGILVSPDNGKSWKALWPLKYDPEAGGHYWRLAISENNGVDRIISASSPWDASKPNQVVISEDGGKSFSRSSQGLPGSRPHANTMWGMGYARAMAADPKDPKTLYLGIDGDPSPNCKTGGGIFKSVDGGATWTQLSAQPGGRRMFFGLAVDPTDSKRLYWSCCGTGGGLWRSDDAGASWQHVFKNEQWLFNLHVTANGTVFCPGKNLWRSTDHGKTWKQLTKFPYNSERLIVAIETDPADPQRMWFATTTWDGSSHGAVYETLDAGSTWQEITANLPYRKPLLLRYNSETRELWAAGVCLFKCKR